MIRTPLFIALLGFGTVASTQVSAQAITTETVGDADSFGRNVKWLGLLSGYVLLDSACEPATPGDPPPENCTVIAPLPAPTVFNMPDLDSITLPKESSTTLLCHWQTPVVSYSVSNYTGSPQQFSIRVTPTYRIENPVLNNPSLINPNTGLPYGGAIELSLTAIYKSGTIADGYNGFEVINGARVCIGGLISKASLMTGYGLNENQADRFFRRKTTITLSLSGQTQMVDFANINIGTRFTGD